jgi:hypothetical protein
VSWDWIKIEERPPEIDQSVLFLYENGTIIHSHIDKDLDEETLSMFLKGSIYTGPIVGWVEPKYPEFL